MVFFFLAQQFSLPEYLSFPGELPTQDSSNFHLMPVHRDSFYLCDQQACAASSMSERIPGQQTLLLELDADYLSYGVSHNIIGTMMCLQKCRASRAKQEE